jgi:hypothetical protein
VLVRVGSAMCQLADTVTWWCYTSVHKNATELMHCVLDAGDTLAYIVAEIITTVSSCMYTLPLTTVSTDTWFATALQPLTTPLLLHSALQYASAQCELCRVC